MAVRHSLSPMTQRKRSNLILAGAAALFLGAAAYAQVPAPTPKPVPQRNLKVLPAEIPQERLLSIMRTYTAALGVKCTFCHVGQNGKRETMDFASDANPHKDIARRMMLMTRRINEQDFGVKDFRESKVTCYTCHRGAAEPLKSPAADIPPAAPKASERG